jgi:hypothetical protein
MLRKRTNESFSIGAISRPTDRKELIMKIKVAFCAAGLSLALPFAAFAQSGDAKYCAALSDKYTTYAQSSGGKSHNTPPADIANAMSKCSTNASASIPVLEKALNDAKVTLPAHS